MLKNLCNLHVKLKELLPSYQQRTPPCCFSLIPNQPIINKKISIFTHTISTCKQNTTPYKPTQNE